MTSIDMGIVPEPVSGAGCFTAPARRPAQRSPFTEVRGAAHNRVLLGAATTAGIIAVTTAASAAVLLGLGA